MPVRRRAYRAAGNAVAVRREWKTGAERRSSERIKIAETESDDSTVFATVPEARGRVFEPAASGVPR